MKRIEIHLRYRRMLACTVTLLAVLACWFLMSREANRLGAPAILTGSSVLACLFILMGLGIRRRLPFWPLGRVSTWTQIHLYVGIFTTAVYVMHVPALIGGGVFESFLSYLFLGVSASGFYGIYASRSIPKKLTAVQGQPRFDQVPWHRTEIANATGATLESVSESVAGRVLDAFYRQSLKPFFASGPTLAYVLVPRGNRRRQLLGDLKELDRYLEDDGRKAAGQFAALVRQRDDLDYQYALQMRLRLWVVFHGILSIVLIGASLVHAALVLRFVG